MRASELSVQNIEDMWRRLGRMRCRERRRGPQTSASAMCRNMCRKRDAMTEKRLRGRLFSQDTSVFRQKIAQIPKCPPSFLPVLSLDLSLWVFLFSLFFLLPLLFPFLSAPSSAVLPPNYFFFIYSSSFIILRGVVGGELPGLYHRNFQSTHCDILRRRGSAAVSTHSRFFTLLASLLSSCSCVHHASS